MIEEERELNLVCQIRLPSDSLALKTGRGIYEHP